MTARDDSARRRRAMRDGIIHYVAGFAASAVGVFTVRVQVQHLPQTDYGLLLSAFAVLAVAATLDFGIGWSAVRVAATSPSLEPGSDDLRFLSAAQTGMLLVGIGGAIAMLVVGSQAARVFEYAPADAPRALEVFAFLGLGFVADEVTSFASAVLQGRRRFGVTTFLTIFGVMLRAAGLVALLSAGHGVVAVARWYAAAAIASLLLSQWLLRRDGVRIPFVAAFPSRAAFIGRLGPGFSLSLLTLGGSWLWDAPRILVAALAGAPSLVPFHVGTRLPTIVPDLTTRISEALYPASAAEPGSSTLESDIDLGLRWPVLLSIAPCIGLIVIGPALLRAWLGEVPPGALAVLRITSFVAVIHAAGVGVLHVLSARGEGHRFISGRVAAVLVALAVSAALSAYTGALGAAYGVLAGTVVSTVTIMMVASRISGVSAWRLCLRAFRGLGLTTVATIAAAAAIAAWVPGIRILLVLAELGVIELVFLATLYVRGARIEERTLLEGMVRRISPRRRGA